ncbi:MAG: hypothetical protein ACOYI4_06820 [Christensenellales bacterium]
MSFSEWPSGSEYLESHVSRQQGVYNYKELVDASVTLTLERIAPLGMQDADAIAAYFQDRYAAEDVPEVVKDETLSTALAYPAHRITGYFGKNEDSTVCKAVFVSTDQWDFIVDILIPVDFFQNYETQVEDLISQLVFKDWAQDV